MKKEFVDKVIKNSVVDTKKYRYVYSVSAEKAEIRRIDFSLLDTTATIDGWEVVKVIDDGSNQFCICACIHSVETYRDLIAKGDVEKVFAYLSDVETKNGPFFNKTMWEAFDIVFPGYRDSLETTEIETEQQEESNGIKWETIDGLATPCNLETVSADELSREIEQLKREAAPIDDAMEADNVPLEEWQEMRAESAALWGKIGVLQYVLYIPGAQRFQTERRFYNTESGDVLTLEDLLLCWSKHKCLRKGWPRFGWYVAACQTYQGGTLEEIRE